MAAGKGSNAKKSGGKKSGARSGQSSGKKGSSTRKKQDSSVVFLDEVLFLLTTAVSILLLLSNLHLCGSLGERLYGFMHGMAGILGYIFPFFFFGTLVFFISNRKNLTAMLKLWGAIMVFWLLSGVFQLFCKTIPENAWELAVYFEAGQKGSGGGMLGGILQALLRPVLGVWGMAVVLIIGLIILMVLITGRSFYQPVRRSSSRIYSTARQDMYRRKEYYDEQRAQAREKRRLEKERRELEQEQELENRKRTERKIKGMVKDPLLKDMEEFADIPSGIPDPMTAVYPFAESKEAEKRPANVTPLYPDLSPMTDFDEPVQETESGEEDWLSSMSQEIDRLFIRKDVRTLDELSGVGQSREQTGEEQAKKGFDQVSDTVYDDKSPDRFETTEEPEIIELEELIGEEMTFSQPAERDSEKRQEAFEEKQDESQGPFSFKRSSAQVDTRTISTASGKVMEVEVKPEDLVEEISGGGGFSVKKSELSDGSRPAQRIGEATAGIGEAGVTIQKPVSPPPVVPAPPPREYRYPPSHLLTPVSGKGTVTKSFELKETAMKLQQTLKSFGVGVSVTNISCGPAVTRFEVSPEQGVKVSKIVSLTDDIKLNLAAADIRIEAPIPGKAAVGIEVPNKEKVTVFFRELIESEEFRNHSSKLAFAVGKDLSGKIIVTNLASMPHLLIAGATGSGKSVCINTLIMSLLYKAKPEEVKLIMVDPKVVELSVYNGIPHLLIPVVTDPKKAAGALNWAVAEMDNRYNRFAEYGVRDLSSYNEKIKKLGTGPDGQPLTPLPQIVIIVDELADLMMVAPGEVEDAICRLAQLARAAGLHLVLATQRPSVNVITGLIKANMPSRIAFAVSSGVDSRTILDMNGAEKLLGKGDMLFSPSGYPKPVRLQGAFVSDTEVFSVVEFLAENTDGPVYQSAVEMRLSAGPGGALDDPDGLSKLDPYFARAGRFVIEKEKASSGMLQRAFKVGFNRAARIVDQLAAAGVVGDEEGTKPRKIIMTSEEFETYLAENQIE